ncbi:MAG: DUF1643 domain-containing protein, partial [Planctomycetota bacterium]|nr:DUF1643 domain-containing protein [Planctomycetota bacterium]
MRRTALFDPTGRYRYRLTRRFPDAPADGPAACFVMLNPSTADAERDDPTIRRCIGFARGWGCATLDVVNLFAFRATRPADLRAAEDPVGPCNQRHVRAAIRRADMVIFAWGDHGALLQRGERLMR